MLGRAPLALCGAERGICCIPGMDVREDDGEGVGVVVVLASEPAVEGECKRVTRASQASGGCSMPKRKMMRGSCFALVWRERDARASTGRSGPWLVRLLLESLGMG